MAQTLYWLKTFDSVWIVPLICSLHIHVSFPCQLNKKPYNSIQLLNLILLWFQISYFSKAKLFAQENMTMYDQLGQFSTAKQVLNSLYRILSCVAPRPGFCLRARRRKHAWHHGHARDSLKAGLGATPLVTDYSNGRAMGPSYLLPAYKHNNYC